MIGAAPVRRDKADVPLPYPFCPQRERKGTHNTLNSSSGIMPADDRQIDIKSPGAGRSCFGRRDLAALEPDTQLSNHPSGRSLLDMAGQQGQKRLHHKGTPAREQSCYLNVVAVVAIGRKVE
ncbi:hypothetical protein TomTYG45_10980 [Sphingobium sp. TomTYG45]